MNKPPVTGRIWDDEALRRDHDEINGIESTPENWGVAFYLVSVILALLGVLLAVLVATLAIED